MYLAANAHNLGCYWGSGGITYYDEAKPFFGLGSEDRLLGFLFIGHHKMEQWPKSVRKPIADKTRWED